jgi:hypothetical protein
MRSDDLAAYQYYGLSDVLKRAFSPFVKKTAKHA